MKSRNQFLFYFLFLLNADFIFSSPKLNLQDGIDSYPTTRHVTFFKDTDNKLTVEDIIREDSIKNIFLTNEGNSSFGLTKARVWGKLSLENTSSKKKEWLFIFEADRMEDVNLYVVSSNKIISSNHYNLHEPFSSRIIKHRKIIFPLPVSETFMTVYFSVKSDDAMELSATVASPLGFAHKNYRDMLIVGLYYGIMLSMIIYNSFLFFSTRDKSYFFYIIYIISYTLVQLSIDGFLHQYLIPESYKIARDFRIYTASFAAIFALIFAVNLLQIRKNHPRIYIMYIILMAICFLPVVFQLIYGFHYGLPVLVYVLFPFCTFQIITSIILSFKMKLARYYFAAWFVFTCGIFIHALTYLEIYAPFTEKFNYSMQWGSAIEALLLSLALGYRINLLRQSIMEKDNELLNTKLTNLKDKMNPHFVLNTISIIISYLKRDINKANEALHYFASAYKYLIRHESDHLILISDEISFTRDYANILLIKFGDIISIQFDIKGKLEKVLIPFLSLQPIVENAYKHGVRKIEKGKIDIIIKVINNSVDIMVKNTSNGLKIRNPYDGTLGAIRRRIQHFFEDGELSIENIGNEIIVKIHYKNNVKK